MKDPSFDYDQFQFKNDGVLASHLLSQLIMLMIKDLILQSLVFIEELLLKIERISKVCIFTFTFAALSTNYGIFSAGAPFYGILDQTKYIIKNIKVPVQGHHGELDYIKGMSDPKTTKKLENEQNKAGVDFNVFGKELNMHSRIKIQVITTQKKLKTLLEVTYFFKKNQNEAYYISKQNIYLQLYFIFLYWYFLSQKILYLIRFQLQF
ncbi:dienelactone hydrolase family protein (macronuclear) [Tetrahymena thermophila SB210]|uniref:Dienelactone hydrolase family protein n=1 Tax=Tetrahymena thermophila (strain SB210) TaxID=312017 RepID=I7MIH1_TETTS|nr:dienelactone hydrolase family protein [Tetrahymena thermophila SB210]EAS04421.2 dienelactone hydrolase family protein [Tetrahymena thermophila SB210]|eukprot:XP_001024666.2 dienelactone hydrolase family protein [Tetrahymena thermophila SB210]